MSPTWTARGNLVLRDAAGADHETAVTIRAFEREELAIEWASVPLRTLMDHRRNWLAGVAR